MSEQREHERVHLAVEVTMESHNNFYTGITDDISEGGVFVATAIPLPVGAVVELDLQLPETAVKIKAVVRWQRNVGSSSDDLPAGCGLQWLDISDEAKAIIRTFTVRRETMFSFESAALAS